MTKGAAMDVPVRNCNRRREPYSECLPQEPSDPVLFLSGRENPLPENDAKTSVVLS